LKIAAVVCDVYEGGDEVFSDKSSQNREVLIGSCPVNRDSGPNQRPDFKPTRNPASMTIVMVNLFLRSDINKYNPTTRHRRDVVVHETEADTFGQTPSISIGFDGLAKPCCTHLNPWTTGPMGIHWPLAPLFSGC